MCEILQKQKKTGKLDFIFLEKLKIREIWKNKKNCAKIIYPGRGFGEKNSPIRMTLTCCVRDTILDVE